MHLHVGTEATTGHNRVLTLCLAQQIVEQFGAEGRWRSRRKARAHAVAGVGGQGELRHQQQATTDILERTVHLALFVAEHPVVQQFVQQLVGMLRRIFRLDRHQRQQPLVDGADDFPRHLNPGAAHALDQPLHASSRGRSSRRRAIWSAARTRASVMPGSEAAWPASRITFSSLFGQAWCSSQALSSGQITS